MSFEVTALLVTWVAILLLGLVVSGLVRQVHALASGRVRVRADEIGLRQGTQAPEFARLAPRAGAGTAGTLLLFLSEGCGSCDEAMDEVAALAARGALRDVAVRALYPARPPAGRAGGNGTGAGPAVQVLGGEAPLFERYQVPATPFAVVVDGSGRVARSEPVGSRHTLRELIQRTAAGTDPPRPVETNA